MSDRAKSFIEKHDIGHSRFVPLHIFERPDMSPVQGLWYYWIFTQSFQIKRETEDSKKRLLTSSRMSVDITWEAVNNPVFRNYIRGLPFWCQFANFGKVAVRKDIFIEMNEMGLTGLHEIASDTTIGREPGTTVGHLI
ncbi:hypothetical protein ACS3SW_11725 [Roseobacteraceae bacterium S113]